MYYTSNNCGGLLQAFALCDVLNTLEEIEALLGQTLAVQDGMGQGEYWGYADWNGCNIQIIFSKTGDTYETMEVWAQAQ